MKYVSIQLKEYPIEPSFSMCTDCVLFSEDYLSLDAIKLSSLIEPVLMQENEPSPLYRDVMRTGIAV